MAAKQKLPRSPMSRRNNTRTIQWFRNGLLNRAKVRAINGKRLQKYEHRKLT